MADSAADRVREAVNPHETEHSPRNVLVWRILSPLSFLLTLITSWYYSFHAPHQHNRHTHSIWGQNAGHHTPFSLNPIIGSIYWLILFLFQIVYNYNLFRPIESVHAAVHLAPTHTLSNLLGFGFVHLWTRGYFWWALLLVIVNFFNLTFSYFRFPKSNRVHHIAVLAGPLAFNFVSLYWVGAVAVHARHVGARIVANVFVWTWLVYGGFYLVAFKDWSIGFALSILTAALGVSQFLTVIVALQWIFAFTIMGLLFVASVIVAFPNATGVRLGHGHVVSEDRERAPLLADEA